jgi:hypothetical protein
VGSTTTQGRPTTRVSAAGRVAFRSGYGVGALITNFRSSIPSPSFPLFTLHWRPHGIQCKTRGRADRYSFLVRLFHPQVGSRIGAAPLGIADLLLPVSSWECPNSATIGPSPIPASSNPACGFPALGLPACFSSGLCRLLQPGSAFAGDAMRNTRYSLNNPSVP